MIETSLVSENRLLLRALRSSVIALRIRHVSLTLLLGDELIGEWPGAYEIPVKANRLMRMHPGTHFARSFIGDAEMGEPKDLLKILDGLSPASIHAIFDGLPSLDEDIDDFDDEPHGVATTDAELECPNCSHNGMQRILGFKAIVLDDTEKARASKAPIPTSRMRTVKETTMVCPKCDTKQPRIDFVANAHRARGELIAERLNLCMPIDPADLRSYILAEHRMGLAYTETLASALMEYCHRAREENTQDFVIDPEAPMWTQMALNVLESDGQIENLGGEVYRRTDSDRALKLFATPHVGFELVSTKTPH